MIYEAQNLTYLFNNNYNRCNKCEHSDIIDIMDKYADIQQLVAMTIFIIMQHITPRELLFLLSFRFHISVYIFIVYY